MGTDARCRVAADDPWYVVGIDVRGQRFISVSTL